MRKLSAQKFVLGKLDLEASILEDIVSGVFTPVLAKHTKSFNLVDTLSVGVGRIQATLSRCSDRSSLGNIETRNFASMPIPTFRSTYKPRLNIPSSIDSR
jgi:hypothetical protein